jgi:signal transduction histidine kinase
MAATEGGITPPLEDVLITHDLWERPARPPDYATEAEALHRFTQLLADDAGTILQQLLALAIDCCAADSSGVSWLERQPDGQEVFRAAAVAGPLAALQGTVAPRNASPCGVCLDLAAPQLFDQPARCFPDFAAVAGPDIYEALVVEFGHQRDGVFGTLWIAAHTPERQFDGEDARMLSHLSNFTAAALRLQRRGGRVTAEGELQDQVLVQIAHDIRQPLQSILGWVQMLRRGDVAATDLPAAYEIIQRNARAQERLLSDLLDLSRIRVGRLKVDLQPVDVCAVVEEVIASFMPVSVSTEVALDCSLDRPVRLVLADQQRLRQIVSNLILNALKFTPASGHASVQVRERDETVEIVVRDNGVGMAPEFLDLVFSPYQQGTQVVSGRPRGVGVGLTIVRELVEACGGTITAHSDGVGMGTTMTVRLLIVADAPHAA